MSILLLGFIAPLLADLLDAITIRAKAARMARKLPRRARQYKFT